MQREAVTRADSATRLRIQRATEFLLDDNGWRESQTAEHRSGRLATSKTRYSKRDSHTLRFRFLGLLLCHDDTPSRLMRLTLKNNRALLMNLT